MSKFEETSLVIMDDHVLLSVRELCHSCTVHAELIIELVDEGILEPKGATVSEWRFGADNIGRLQTALRLHRELRINYPGVALVLNLLEENKAMRQRLRIFE